jgi:hypothetical protein
LNLKLIGNYIKNVKLKYKSIQQVSSRSYPFRIIAQELVRGNTDIIYILQIVGKNLVSKVYAAELFNDKQLLNALSPYDLLLFLNSFNKKIVCRKGNLLIFPCSSHYKLVSRQYDHFTQQTIFTIEIVQSGKTVQKKLTALQIVNNPFLLERLSAKETYEIGFTIGSETILKEIHQLMSFKGN